MAGATRRKNKHQLLLFEIALPQLPGANYSRRLLAEAKFLARLEALGATPLYPMWRGNQTPHKVRCSRGHERFVRPDDITRGQGICRTCAGKDPAETEAKFRARVIRLGGTPLYVKWDGSLSPHLVRCPEGHLSSPRPHDVLDRGGGICRECTGNSPIRSEAHFLARLAEMGATPLYSKWMGCHAGHTVRCAAGHVRSLIPNSVRRGRGCPACAERDSVISEAKFRSRVVALGGEVLEETWLGVDTPHRVRCAYGHECRPSPTSIAQGRGLCRHCMGKSWDIFYVTASLAAGRVKFGVTSVDVRDRLYRHRRNGYTSVHFVGRVTGADVLEREVLDTLAAHGVKPVRGREYFDADLAVPTILSVVQSWVDDGRLLVESMEQMASGL